MLDVRDRVRKVYIPVFDRLEIQIQGKKRKLLLLAFSMADSMPSIKAVRRVRL